MMRQATRADLDEIIRLEKSCFPETAFSRSTFLYYMSSASSEVHLVDVDGELAGYVVFTRRHAPSHFYIDSIAVKPGRRRQGLGHRMMSRVTSVARRRGVKRIRLHVRSSNRAAATFYRALGFVQKGTVREYYRNGEDGLVMERHIET